MSQTPPPVPQTPPAFGPGPAARKSNGPAITSLVLGLALCVPFLTSALAVVFGAVGLRRARDPQVGGKGLAVAGLVLGLAGIVLWFLFGATISTAVVALVKGTEVPRATARQFGEDLSNGRIDAALAGCATGMGRQVLADDYEAIKPWGAMTDMTSNSVNVSSINGVSTCELAGTATFAQTSKTYQFKLIKDGDAWKIVQFNFK